MIALARLYATLAYFHPFWDEAAHAVGLVQALESPTKEVLADALAALGDPLTGLVEPETPAAGGSFYSATSAGGAALLVLTNVALLAPPQAQEALALFWQRALGAPRLICDLRADAPAAAQDAERLVALTEGIALPTLWQRAHYGKTPEGESSTGGFREGWLVRSALLRSARWPLTVFLVTRHTPLPPFAAALQHLGLATIFLVGEGELETRWCASWTRLPLPEGRVARVRTGLVSVVADQRFRSEAEAREAAERWLAKPTPTPPSAPRVPPPPVTLPQSRLQAALRLWSAIWLLHPDRVRLRPLWEAAWPAFFARTRAAQTPLAFLRAVRALLVVTGDGHATTRSRFEGALFGGVPALVRVREIQGRYTITRLTHPAAAEGGVGQGDVLVRIEGLPTAQRAAQLIPWLAASTPQARSNYIANRLLLGEPGTSVSLVVVGKEGKARTAVCPRLVPAGPRLPEREGAPVRLLAPGLVYADLDRLRREELQALFHDHGKAQALIFDLRGYTDALAWELAPYLARAEKTVAARYERPIAVPPEGQELAQRALTEQFVQLIPPRAGRVAFTGKAVALIDERTQSQAELTALFLVACGAVLIGSPTAGAVGDVTSVALTDGILARFTGQDVCFPDGRRVSRIGIVPQVRVLPTLAGVRAGRDEVLEAALHWVRARRR